MTDAFREDPRWQEAQRDYLDDGREGEDHDAVYARRIQAAERLRQIEKEYRST